MKRRQTKFISVTKPFVPSCTRSVASTVHVTSFHFVTLYHTHTGMPTKTSTRSETQTHFPKHRKNRERKVHPTPPPKNAYNNQPYPDIHTDPLHTRNPQTPPNTHSPNEVFNHDRRFSASGACEYPEIYGYAHTHDGFESRPRLANTWKCRGY